MSTATPFPWPGLSASENPKTTFRAVFEHSPLAVARCSLQGMILEMNPAFEHGVEREMGVRHALRLCELVRPQERRETELLLHELLVSQRDGFSIGTADMGPGRTGPKWTAWRQPGSGAEPDHLLLLLIAERLSESVSAEESLIQAQRWEAVGRLAGGVAHDFNNLLTGVMLYCDLLLSSMETVDRRRRYADEIRSAIVQASALVRQLLVFARPQPAPENPVSLNEIAAAMRDLMGRLIGEHIALELRLDPDLGLIKIEPAQAQQILLNLVLNARDALPQGGKITVEIGNCNFQPLAGALSRPKPAFPCVLLVVADNGCGMNTETRRRLFEPFFTTKNEGRGTGLGLTTVRSIVASNGGLIHFESEDGGGTRAMILLPRASSVAGAFAGAQESLPAGISNAESSRLAAESPRPEISRPDISSSDISSSEIPGQEQFHEMKKESPL